MSEATARPTLNYRTVLQRPSANKADKMTITISQTGTFCSHRPNTRQTLEGLMKATYFIKCMYYPSKQAFFKARMQHQTQNTYFMITL
jgi:hypothetical protein